MKSLLFLPLLLLAGCQTISTQQNADIQAELQAISNDAVAATPASVSSIQGHVQALAGLLHVTVTPVQVIK